jgi:O-acetylserine/cysteine efflux transporter
LRLGGMVTVVCGIAVMLLSKRPQASSKLALSKQDLPGIA